MQMIRPAESGAKRAPAPELAHLCAALQSCGVRAAQNAAGAGRKGGAGPSEGRVIIIGGRHVNVPLRSWYAAGSPYALEVDGQGWVLTCRGRYAATAELPPVPRYYTRTTSRGVALSKVALIHGSGCLASTVYQDCRYWRTGMQCTFCGIGLSLEQQATVRVKAPVDLARAARLAAELDGAAHVTLTAGHCGGEFDLTGHYCSCIRAIKRAVDLPVHVQLCPPEHIGAYRQLHAAGADTVGIHCESWDIAALRRHAPAKAAAGLDTYRRHWEQAVSVFGPNQVSSFLIAGLGETADCLLDGAETMARMGVFPYVLPLRPVPGTPLAAFAPPDLEYMIGLYRQTAGILSCYGLASAASKAGCVRCGACSCLALFEEAHAP